MEWGAGPRPRSARPAPGCRCRVARHQRVRPAWWWSCWSIMVLGSPPDSSKRSSPTQGLAHRGHPGYPTGGGLEGRVSLCGTDSRIAARSDVLPHAAPGQCTSPHAIPSFRPLPGLVRGRQRDQFPDQPAVFFAQLDLRPWDQAGADLGHDTAQPSELRLLHRQVVLELEQTESRHGRLLALRSAEVAHQRAELLGGPLEVAAALLQEGGGLGRREATEEAEAGGEARVLLHWLGDKLAQPIIETAATGVGEGVDRARGSAPGALGRLGGDEVVAHQRLDHGVEGAVVELDAAVHVAVAHHLGHLVGVHRPLEQEREHGEGEWVGGRRFLRWHYPASKYPGTSICPRASCCKRPSARPEASRTEPPRDQRVPVALPIRLSHTHRPCPDAAGAFPLRLRRVPALIQNLAPNADFVNGTMNNFNHQTRFINPVVRPAGNRRATGNRRPGLL